MAQKEMVEDRLRLIESELTRLKQFLERGIVEIPVDSTTPTSAPVAPLSLGTAHPLAHFAGRLRDHPQLDEWREIVEEQRRILDESEGVK